MNVLVSLMIKISLMVGLGYLLKKTHVIDDGLQKGISNLLVTAVLPLNIVVSSCQELTEESLHGAFFATVFSLVYYIAALIFMTLFSKRLNLSENRQNLIVTMAVFANTGFIGFPLVEEMFGNQNLIYAVIYNMFYQIFFYTYGMYLLSSDKKVNLGAILKAPVTIASFLSLILFLGQIPLPEVLKSTFSSIGSMTVPLSMLVIGCSIADIKLIEVVKDRYSYLISALRLLIFPVISILIMKLIGAGSTVAGICVLITGLPSGSLNVIVAQQQDSEPEFAARAVVQSMLFMLISLPIMFWAVQRL